MQKETTTAKEVLFRHASIVTFSHHASGLDISKVRGFHDNMCKKAFSAAAIPKDAYEKRPHNAN